jgi:hypothetical protein
MTSRKVTEEEIETVTVYSDKLVLHRVLEKYQSQDGLTRYRFTPQFVKHMQQFIQFQEDNPEFRKDENGKELGEVDGIMLALTMYFVVNRRLDRSPQPYLEIDIKHLLDESLTLLDKMTETDDDIQELMEMSKVVLTQVRLLWLDRDSKK